jgi:hypothetical protein
MLLTKLIKTRPFLKARARAFWLKYDQFCGLGTRCIGPFNPVARIFSRPTVWSSHETREIGPLNPVTRILSRPTVWSPHENREIGPLNPVLRILSRTAGSTLRLKNSRNILMKL